MVIRKLEAAGWTKRCKEGSHQMMIHPTEGRVVPVPDPKKDLGRGLLRAWRSRPASSSYRNERAMRYGA
ncbi:MAG: type II toxin-antitoxin system HicA family toxin [Candidatus Binatia bacterium]|nr:type II toxin-antitoxin system HicA family toxin [Candidatus Binatia bacterium]